MGYAYELENGQRLVLENNSSGTLVGLSSARAGQQQSQAVGFRTGKWSKPPALFRLKKDLVLRIETKADTWLIQVRGNEIRRMTNNPDLEEAEKLHLEKSDTSIRMKPMESMKPLKPLRPMRPMEMRMGDMHMSMGKGEMDEEPERRFCTTCGKPAKPGDRFCGHCGKALSTTE